MKTAQKQAADILAVAQKNLASLELAQRLGARIPRIEFERVWEWYHAQLATIGLQNRFGSLVPHEVRR